MRPATMLVLAGAAVATAVTGCGGSAAPDNAARAATRTVVTPVAPATSSPPGPRPSSGGGWPAAMRDARHSGAAGTVGPQSGAIRWRRRLEGPVVPGPVVGADGVVYAASNAGVLHALRPGTGEDLWTYDGGGAYGSDLSTSPLLTRSGLLVWPGPRDTLFGLDARTGHLRWRLALPGAPLSPSLGPDGTLYVADMAGGLSAIAVTAARATVRWRVRLGGTSYGSAAVDTRGGSTTVYGTADDALVAVRDDGTRGTVRWRARTRGLVEVSPSVGSDGVVTVGSNDKQLHAFDAAGHPLWQAPLDSLTYSSSVSPADGTVVVGDHRGAVSRLRRRDGTLVGRVVGLPQTPRRRSVGVWTAPAIDRQGDVYFGTRAGHIYGFSYAGRRLFDVDTGATVDSYPALGPDGTLYIGSENGLLYAIGGRSRG